MLLSPEPYLMWEIAEQCGFTSQHYFCRVFKTALVSVLSNAAR